MLNYLGPSGGTIHTNDIEVFSIRSTTQPSDSLRGSTRLDILSYPKNLGTALLTRSAKLEMDVLRRNVDMPL